MPCQVEKGIHRDAPPAGMQAGGVLFLGFGRLIATVETAQAMVEGTSALTQTLGKREAEITPVVISRSYIRARQFNT
nr:hypothetical protein [Bacteroides intestinalis]